MVYRAAHVSQKDGTPLQFANCRMAVGATHLDFHTNGAETSTGAAMRSYQFDQSGGTDADDLRRAWERGYGETLVIRNGRYWDALLIDRAKGWFLEVDIWYADLADRCQQSANFGHTIGIAPETRADGFWLVSDPLCSGYKWMHPDAIRKAVQSWGNRVVRANLSNPPIYYTTSEVATVDTINTSGYIESSKVATTKVGSYWWYDNDCKLSGAQFTKATKLPFVGATKEATRAVIVSTKLPYPDGVARPTIVYMKTADIVVSDAPTPTPIPPPAPVPDCDAEVATERARWMAWVVTAPGPRTP